jgi:CYTH domain-containing protein
MTLAAAVPASPGVGKYARVERERRFLMAGPPPETAVTATRRITDRYLVGTSLRLRRVEHLDNGTCEFKFTQKVAADQPGPVQGLITTIYLTQAEYDRLASLQAMTLCKTRVSVPPVGFDVFDPPLDGLVLAEAEFATDEDALSFIPPHGVIAEVTDDARFTGGRLVQAQRHELLGWLAEYGIANHPRDLPA